LAKTGADFVKPVPRSPQSSYGPNCFKGGDSYVVQHFDTAETDLQDVFGENNPERRRAAIDEIYTEDSQVQIINGRYVFPATGGVPQDANNGPIFGLLFDGSLGQQAVVV
jgi:hypothetical protein